MIKVITVLAEVGELIVWSAILYGVILLNKQGKFQEGRNSND